jgi:CCR4-NOT transcription complex subunit 6
LFSLRSADGLPAARKLEGRSVAPGTFTVLSYNMLADLYARSDIYSYCPPWALSWAYRRQNLLREVVGYQADILCLQEVLLVYSLQTFGPFISCCCLCICHSLADLIFGDMEIPGYNEVKGTQKG